MATPILAPTLPEKLHVETRYDGNYGLLALGRVRVNIDEDSHHYTIHLDTKSRGIASWFASMKSVAEVQGSVTTDGRYIPQLYTSNAEKDGGEKGLQQYTAYDAAGAIKERKREPLDDPNWRPLVSLAEANTGIDPISAYLVLRPKLREMLAENSSDTTLRTYDGARLAEMHFHYARRANLEIMGEDMAVIDTKIQRKIIAGYTPKEQKKFTEGDPEIHVYFSDDARLLPVMITVALGLGELKIELTELKSSL